MTKYDVFWIIVLLASLLIIIIWAILNISYAIIREKLLAKATNQENNEGKEKERIKKLLENQDEFPYSYNDLKHESNNTDF